MGGVLNIFILNLYGLIFRKGIQSSKKGVSLQKRESVFKNGSQSSKKGVCFQKRESIFKKGSLSLKKGVNL